MIGRRGGRGSRILRRGRRPPPTYTRGRYCTQELIVRQNHTYIYKPWYVQERWWGVAGGTFRVVTGGVVSVVAMGGAPSSSHLACHFSLSRHSRNMTIWNSIGKSMEKGLIGKRDCKYLSLLPNKIRNVEGSMREKRPSRDGAGALCCESTEGGAETFKELHSLCELLHESPSLLQT